MEIAKAILSHFFKFGKPQTRYRDVKTGRFVKELKKARVTIGTAIYPVGKSKTKRYTLWTVTDVDLVEETKDRLLEEMYREIERDVGYERSDWWFEVEVGFEVVEVEGD